MFRYRRLNVIINKEMILHSLDLPASLPQPDIQAMAGTKQHFTFILLLN